jgi:hypothetical protein
MQTVCEVVAEAITSCEAICKVIALKYELSQTNFAQNIIFSVFY